MTSSSLSIKKIQHFIEQYNYGLKHVYVKPDNTIILEILCRNPLNIIFVYIPHEYNVITDVDTTPLTKYKIKRDQPTMSLMNDLYNLDTGLEVPYNKPLVVPSENVDREITYRILREQYDRLKLCLKGTRYRLALTSDNSVCMSSCIYKSEIPFTQKIYLVMDLSDFHNRIRTASTECDLLIDKMYRLFNENEQMHMDDIKNLLDNKYKFISTHQTIIQLKKDFKQHILQYSDVYNKLKLAEEDKHKEMLIAKQPTDQLKHEIRRTHQMKQLEQEIDEIRKLKAKTEHTIIELKTKEASLFLTIDQILYESIINLNKTFKQLNLMIQLVEK